MDRDYDDISAMAADREKIIIRTSMVGILTNFLLAGFKAAVGVFTRSIAVTLDAVNNLSDALSSIVTIAGAKYGAREPDKQHPLGHGRMEYLSSLVVAGIVLYAGITSLNESFKKILHPEAASYSVTSLMILAVAVAVKIVLGRYVKRQGERVQSGALIASGADASFDAVLSASVLASAIIFLLSGISLEAYVGIFISAVIIKAGIEMMRDTLNDILGQRADQETSTKIRQILCEEPEVYGAYDLILYNYGPNRDYGTVHLELPDTMTVEEVDVITRRVQRRVYRETGVILTGVGVYSHITTNKDAARMRNRIQKVIMSHDWALQMHGFHADMEKKEIRFDVVLSFDVDRNEALAELTGQIREMYPDYTLEIVPDLDVAD